ncbi:C40 family peptidase [Streptomyces sp. NPDC056987]|uniref:C40 family peptidase n=1 Tax=Streptomyces sp. NPDC056987 TaxID=3345988 RepID=UPI00362FF083
MGAPLAVAAVRSPWGRRAGLAIGTAVVGAALVPLALIGTLMSPASDIDMNNVTCAMSDMKLGASGLNLTAEQTRNSETIVSTGANMGVPVRGQVIAIATAMQESSLRNLDGGDRDSVGLFQQRPSQGWGTVAQIMNPVYASTQFYRHLLAVPGWQKMAVTDAAQAVQNSGFPEAYAKHEARAVSVVAGMSSGGVEQINAATGCTPLSSPASSNVKGYVAVALQQTGKPYVWGATGPDSFDCSGLIVYAWRQMGKQLKVRTSQQMYDVSVPVPAGSEQSGDLIFTEFGQQDGMAGPAHVLIVVGPGLAVEAPRTGLDVRVRKYDPKTENMRFGRLPESQMTTISTQA